MFRECVYRDSQGASSILWLVLETSHSLTALSYQTLYSIASGGMGRVDVAVRREGSFERLFAVKRLKPELASDEHIRAMFLDEARIAGLVRHANVVSVLDVGHDSSGPYLVMELIEGISVAELLTNRAVHPLPVEVALRIAMQTAEGLHAAHELRTPNGTSLELVHRDISPQNILLGFDGVARVTDFGIAKAFGRSTQTSTGILKGKVGYISPEQLRFEEPDRRADLFSLGVVLFELLTGRRLYRSAKDLEGPRRILTEPPPDLGEYRDDVEPELVQMMFQLLAKKREDRPATAKEVARRLEGMIASLNAAGEVADTTELLSQHFGSRRDELRAKTEEALQRSREEALRAAAEPVKVPSRPRVKLLGAAALVTVAGVAVAYALNTNRPAVASTNPEPRVSAQPELEPVAPVVETAVSAAATPPEASTQEPGVKAPAAKRTVPAAPRRPAPSDKPKVPLWETY